MDKLAPLYAKTLWMSTNPGACAEHDAADLFSRFSAENFLQGRGYRGVRGALFEEVHEKVRLHKDLMIRPVHGVIGVVLPHQAANPPGDGGVKAQTGEHLPGGEDTFLLLERALAAAVFFLRGQDADIMDQSRGLQGELKAGFQPFRMADQPGKTVYL